MKNKIQRGSMTVEMAMLMPLILLVLMSVLFLFFWIHNRTWLTAASYEAALDGSMEVVVPDGKIYEKALGKGRELGNMGFFSSRNLQVQVCTGKKVKVIYDLDMYSLYSGFQNHLRTEASVKVIKPVKWIRKAKGAAEILKKLGENENES